MLGPPEFLHLLCSFYFHRKRTGFTSRCELQKAAHI